MAAAPAVGSQSRVKAVSRVLPVMMMPVVALLLPCTRLPQRRPLCPGPALALAVVVVVVVVTWSGPRREVVSR
jgi:hypothetical protein